MAFAISNLTSQELSTLRNVNVKQEILLINLKIKIGEGNRFSLVRRDSHLYRFITILKWLNLDFIYTRCSNYLTRSKDVKSYLQQYNWNPCSKNYQFYKKMGYLDTDPQLQVYENLRIQGLIN